MGLLDRGQIEVLGNPVPSGLPEAAAQRRVLEQALDRSSEALRIAWRNEQPGVSVNHDFRHAADVRRDNREAGCHRLEDREWKPLGVAREDEDVGGAEQLGNIIALAEKLDGGLESEAPHLLLDLGPIGPLTDEHGLKGMSPQRGQCTNERDGVLGCLKTPDCHESGSPRVGLAGPEAPWIDPVADDDRGPFLARVCRKARSTLAVRDADGDRRQRTQKPLRPPVEGGGGPAVRPERPSMHRVDPDRHARERGRQSAQGARLRTVHVNDVRLLAAQQGQELQKAKYVAPETERAPHLPERDETDARRSRGVAEWAVSVGCYGHVEAVGKRREKGCNVRLRPSRLGQGHDEQNSWTHERTASR